MIKVTKCHKCSQTHTQIINDHTRNVTEAIRDELEILGWHMLGKKSRWLCENCKEHEMSSWGGYE